MTTALLDDGEPVFPNPDHRRTYPREYERSHQQRDLAHDPRCQHDSEFCAPRFAATTPCNQPLISGRCSLHGVQS